MKKKGIFTHRLRGSDDDPLSGMANLFDLAMVFAVALMVAMVSYFKISELLTKDDVTMIKNPGEKNMEIIVKKGKEIVRYKAKEGKGKGRGKRVGVAYELENGQIIYVPE
ncbi:MAG: DUF2149 domain-containing protein [Candidatus Omnitrophota bacterium]|nr:DUF2149 domain-containing protein [Candidatus Omnitrophota bacterium]